MAKPKPITPAYEYAALPLRVIDGDTIEVRVDVGFRAFVVTPLRLLGVNAPEKDTPAGQLAKEWTTSWLHIHDGPLLGLWIRSAHPGIYGDKYGRWLATIRDWTGMHVMNEEILAAGHAVPFTG